EVVLPEPVVPISVACRSSSCSPSQNGCVAKTGATWSGAEVTLPRTKLGRPLLTSGFAIDVFSGRCQATMRATAAAARRFRASTGEPDYERRHRAETARPRRLHRDQTRAGGWP